MNLGIYVPSSTKDERMVSIAKRLHSGLDSGFLSDATLFYDNAGPNDIPCRFGFFNSADMWSFSGSLITTSVETTIRAASIVNKIDLFFYHGWEQNKDVIGLIAATGRKNVKTVCRNEEGGREFTRLTGRKPHGIIEDFNIDDIIKVLR